MGTHTYQLCVRGQLSERRLSEFAELTVAHTADGDTLITAPAIDQAALHALLHRVRDLGLELLMLKIVAPPGADDRGRP